MVQPDLSCQSRDTDDPHARTAFLLQAPDPSFRECNYSFGYPGRFAPFAPTAVPILFVKLLCVCY